MKTYHNKTMRYKSYVFEKFLDYILCTDKQSQKKLIKYCTDRGIELNNEVFEDLCQKHGV